VVMLQTGVVVLLLAALARALLPGGDAPAEQHTDGMETGRRSCGSTWLCARGVLLWSGGIQARQTDRVERSNGARPQRCTLA
jgi:hypothetical protein